MAWESVVSHKRTFVDALEVQNDQAIGWLRKGCCSFGGGTAVIGLARSLIRHLWWSWVGGKFKRAKQDIQLDG
jgi:hypothetical protein